MFHVGLHVACCVACCMLHVAWCMLCCTLHTVLHAARCMLHVACCMLHVACCTLHVACCVACCMPVAQDGFGASQRARPACVRACVPVCVRECVRAQHKDYCQATSNRREIKCARVSMRTARTHATCVSMRTARTHATCVAPAHGPRHATCTRTTWNSPRTTLRRRPARSVQQTDDELQQTDGAPRVATRTATCRSATCRSVPRVGPREVRCIRIGPGRSHQYTHAHTHARARTHTHTHTHTRTFAHHVRAERWWRFLSGRLGDSSAVTTKYQERWLRCACCRPHRPTPTSGRHVHPPAVSAVCARLCRASPLQATVYGAPTTHVANVARCQHC
jgi:hypothetical protein